MSSNYVLVSGVFDPIHAGHLAYLRAASDYGPLLCVLSDAPEKHPPLVPLADRAALLKWLGADKVITGSTVAQVLEQERPRAYIKGSDWRDRLPADQVEVCQRLKISMVYTETRKASSSALLANYERARNAQKLAALERFVQSQTPAEQVWEPVTDYSRDTRRAIEATQADILAEVFKGCSVFDYGCGFGYLVELLTERGMDAEGWDPRQRRECPIVLRDAVICREVLEHLTVREAVGVVHELIAMADRYVYVTTRFTGKSHLLDVDAADTLDPTHITMLNQDLLRTLFVLEGCTRRADLEARLDWMQLGRVLVYEVPRD